MIKLISSLGILLFVLSVGSLIAQTPQAINYQAVARDNSGAPLTNQNVSLRISITANSINGNAVYSEIHRPTTNSFGLFNLSVGRGNSPAGDFSAIDWSTGAYFIKVEMDTNGGSNYQLMGSSQLLAVPYALYAQRAGNANDADADPANELQQLTLNGNTLSISNGNSIVLPNNATDPLWTKVENDIYYNKGKVSIGTDLTNTSAILNIRGSLSQLNSAEKIKLLQGINSNGNGFYSVRDNNLKSLSFLGTSSDGTAGYFGLYNNNGVALSSLTVTSDSKSGYFEINDTSDLRIASISSTTSGGGFMGTWGPNGTANTRISSLSTNSNHGFISVYNAITDGTGESKAGIYVNAEGQGIVFGDTKNFRMKHPTQADKEIWYASIEGPEAAAYVRGTGKLINGEAQITFPDHFDIVANKETMTVILTPLSAESKGLAVIQKGKGGIKVKELANGTGNYEFDWEVKAVRKGYENYRVIRNASETMPAEPAKPIETDHKNGR